MAVMANTNSMIRLFVVAAIVAAAGFALFMMLTTPDQRSFSQKVGDAVDALPDGGDKAVRQLEDRTPADKIGDALKDGRKEVEKNAR
ncbi:MAG: hypothetical protein WDO70_12135 [Alphaproteobacteria bacterium]